MLQSLGVPDWQTDARSDAEELVEVSGRLCYKAFGTTLNANLTKVREGNHDYVGNILRQRHGSVIEHATVTFALLNVSRVFTHELVRHRAGAAYSQESMRFVRIDNIGMYDPHALSPDFLEQHLAPYACGHNNHRGWAKSVSEGIKETFQRKVEELEYIIVKTADDLGLNNPAMPFAVKKMVTSALRRLAPDGMLTSIIVTCNHRAWRHMIEMRTAPGAEEEIRRVFLDIGEQLLKRFPALYQDMSLNVNADGTSSWVFTHSKV